MTERIDTPENSDFIINQAIFDNPANPELPDRRDLDPDFYIVEDIDPYLPDTMSVEF